MGIKGLNLPEETSLAQFETTVATRRPDLFTGPFSWPVMTLEEAALAHNLATMARFCARSGVDLAPHIKTHMSAQLWQRQHQAGAWGATVATADQLRRVRAWGTRRILLANQLTDPRELAWLAEHVRAAGSEDLTVWLYADSRAGIELLAAHLSAPEVREHVGVLIERGHPGGRTGARTLAEAGALAIAARDAGLRVVGVSGYEGSVASGTDPEALAAVTGFCTDLLATARAVAQAIGAQRPVLSVGGSAYLDVVESVLAEVTEEFQVVIRSGSYLSHDHGLYTRSDPWSRMQVPAQLHPALRLWAQVLSVPEDGLVLCGAGRRDAPFDADMPIPLQVHPPGGQGPARALTGTTAALNDQHLYLRTADRVAVGEVIEFGVSHPCTSFDKWATLPVLDDGHVTGLVHTEF